MILPSDLIDKIEYFEHTYKQGSGAQVYDVFTLHFKAWWRPQRKIKIERIVKNYNKETGEFTHTSTTGAADLYNQLNGWAIQTHKEKLDSVKMKYDKHDTLADVLVMKPRPKDIDDD